jgi:hypothetical protein
MIMEYQEKLEINFLEQKLSENNNYSNIFNNIRFRGWYRFELEEGFVKHTFCLFRIPPAIPLYDNVLKKFSEEERKAGIHRFLIGKDLVEEVSSLLEKFKGNFAECVASLEDSQVTDLLNRFSKMVTFDCNKIPYLHIKKLIGDPSDKLDTDEEVKKHILKYPNFLDIFYDVLNEKITLDEADIKSGGIIYNEYSKYLSSFRGKNKNESN